MSDPLMFCRHPDGSAHPVRPYPQGTWISVELLDEIGDTWREPDDPDILRFASDCRYMICEYDAARHAFVLSRIP